MKIMKTAMVGEELNWARRGDEHTQGAGPQTQSMVSS
jgi:hypothetical protein